MYRVAFKMLAHDRAKFFGLVLGITFATVLIAQQAGMGWSAVAMSVNAVRDLTEADVWVMKPNVEFVDMADPMPETDLSRVRSVAGVRWAVPYYTGQGMLRSTAGLFKAVLIQGVDDHTLTGAPGKVVLGDARELARDGAVLLDLAGYAKMFPGEPPALGREFEVGQQRAVLVGLFDSPANFNGLPLVVTRRSLAVRMARETLNAMTYVLVKAAPGQDPAEVARRVSRETGLKALTREDFMAEGIGWMAENSGIVENFAVTVALGLVVGVVIVGQTFYMFSAENIRQFAALKAIGVGDRVILKMLLAQAGYVAALGYGLGIGLSALAFYGMNASPTSPLRGMFMPDAVAVGSAALVLVMVLAAGLVSAWKVLTVDPALVFRG